MALIVEDGTGMATATSLVDLTYVNSYHTLRGNAAWTGADADKEAAIVRANARLATAYGWTGKRTFKRVQALVIPRTGMYDCENNLIPDTETPIEVKKAVAEMSLLELVKPSSTTAASATSTTAATKRVKVGSIEKEYFASATATVTAVDATKALAIVTGLLKCFASPVDGSNLAGSNVARFGASKRV